MPPAHSTPSTAQTQHSGIYTHWRPTRRGLDPTASLTHAWLNTQHSSQSRANITPTSTQIFVQNPQPADIIAEIKAQMMPQLHDYIVKHTAAQLATKRNDPAAPHHRDAAEALYRTLSRG